MFFSRWFHVVHGFGLASMVFQGVFMVFLDFHMVFKLVFGRSPCFSQGNFMVSYFIWKVSVSNAEVARKCTHSNFIKAQISNLGMPAVGQE